MEQEQATLRAQFQREDALRYESLFTARECARLTKPWVLPPEGHSPGDVLEENFQSLGSWGINNLEGLIVTALFPPLLPWFKSSLRPEIEYDPGVPVELKEQFNEALFLRDLILLATLESAGGRGELRGRKTGFRSAKRASISQLLITGDTLEQMNDQYQIQVWRRDQYVTARDSSGLVLHHLTLAKKDPLSLTNEQCAAIGLKVEELQKKPSADRMMDLTTRVEWHPRSKKWVIEQEMNNKIIPLGSDAKMASEETVSPFFSTPLDLVGGEHYGRGLVEMNKGDLRSLDALSERSLDWAGLASKMVPCIDDASPTKEADLARPTGEPIRTRVLAGVPQEIGFLSVNKVADWQVVRELMQDIQTRLSKTMLIGTESVRDSERTTKFEVQAVTIKQAEGALGGFYTPIADCQQLPVINRTVFQAEADKLLKPLPKDAVQIQILTGIAALARSAKVGELLNIAQVAQALGPEAIAKLDARGLLDTLARYQNIYEPGVIKSNERVDAERKQAADAEIARVAQEQAIQSTGNIVEAAAGQAQQPIRR